MASGRIRAAGVIALDRTKKSSRVLLVHRPRHKDWSLPKGKLDNGEHIVSAAVRECNEETGVVPVLMSFVGQQRYRIPGGNKSVDYWRAKVGIDNGFDPNNEVDEIDWVSLDRARKRLTYARDADYLERAAALPSTVPLVLLRHTQAEKRSDFNGKDHRRPLTSKGKSKAKDLNSILAAYGCERIISSTATRCLQTVEPYAQSMGAKIKEDPALSEEVAKSDPEQPASAIKQLMESRRPLLVCSHRPVLPLLVDPLIKALPADQAAAMTKPLPPGGILVVHRTVKKTGWQIESVERHEI